tara:strand:+ start:188 stop:544 length:357 start_codon:yes stop_codon:yes gene_type:complete
MATYKIKSGDTLSQIAKKYNTTIRTLQKNNNIKDPNKIRAGKTLDLGPLKPGLSSQRKMSPYAGQSPSEMRAMAMKKNKKTTKPKAIAAKPTKRPAAIGKKKLTGTAGRRQRRMTRRA